jgi:hypothetical protein
MAYWRKIPRSNSRTKSNPNKKLIEAGRKQREKNNHFFL